MLGGAGRVSSAVSAGAVLWWASLAWLISTVRHRLDPDRLRLINQLAGVVLLGFGTGLLARYGVNMIG